jgi:hypothetical protein
MKRGIPGVIPVVAQICPIGHRGLPDRIVARPANTGDPTSAGHPGRARLVPTDDPSRRPRLRTQG